MWECGSSGFCVVPACTVDSSVERLVGPEANDRQPQGVHRQFIVLHVFAEYVRHAGCPSLAFDFRVVCGISEHLFKLNTRRIGRLPQIVEHDLLHFDVDIRKGAVLDVRLNDVVLSLLVNDCPLNIAVEEVKGAGLVTLYRESIAAEVKLGPTG
jgi:hypothetical protein